MFLTHKEKESESSLSKKNIHEAQMVANLSIYLSSQKSK